VLLAVAADAQRTQLRMSVNSQGDQANGYCELPSMSGDGRRVAFISAATNLVLGDTNGVDDVFVHDRVDGRTIRASVSSAGAQSNGWNAYPAISADGAWLAFASDGNNLVAGDTNGARDVFLIEIATGQLARVSVGSSGEQANAESATGAASIAVSADGRYVAFNSLADNLVRGDTNQRLDVFVHDRVTGQTTRVSVRSSGEQATDSSGFGGMAISGDGRIVAFCSTANDLAPGDTNVVSDVFVHDRVTSVTTRVSVSSAGIEGDAYSIAPALSYDGRVVAFLSAASTLVPLDTNGRLDVFVHDRLNGVTLRASEGPGDVQWAFDSLFPSLSADGRYVAFETRNAQSPSPFQILVIDLATDQIVLASHAPEPPPFHSGNGDSTAASLSGDGSIVAFRSVATNLIFGDTNGVKDIYLTALFDELPTITSYCTAGTSTHGCRPSISAGGLPRASASSGFTITVSGVEGQKAGMIFYGISGAQSVPFGATSSTMCVRPPHQRTDVQFSGGTLGMCDGTLVLDWNAKEK
jgi:Tol biopolymer transport system component